MRTFSDNAAVVDAHTQTKARTKTQAPDPPAALRTFLPWGWAGVLFLLYATVAVRRHQLLRTTGYDLGIFEQAVRAYAQLRAPVVPLRGEGFNLLGDHFHPLIAVLAPFYRLWPSPVCLLVAQAALLAVAVVPLARWAARVLGRRAAHVVAFGYGASWGIASAAAFDFHEVALAVPLLAFALEALGRGRWRRAVAWGAPLLLVKEDLGLTLAALGAYVAWKGPRRLGIATAVAGVAGSLIEIKLLLPAFNPGGGYAHGGNLADAHGSLLADLAFMPLDALRPDVKAMTLVLVFAPSALIALRSPLALLAVPTLAWRMLSENSFHWGTAFHYSAVLMPIVFAGLIDALGRHRDEAATAPGTVATPGSTGTPTEPGTPTAPGTGAPTPAHAAAADAPAADVRTADPSAGRRPGPRPPALRRWAARAQGARGPAARHVRASLATVFAVTVVMLPSFPLAQLAQRATWHTTRHIEAAHALLRQIPDGATVAASNRLAPQLTSRCQVVIFPTWPVEGRLYEYDRKRLPRPTAEWIIHDRRAPEAWPYRTGHWPYPPEQQLAELEEAQRSYGYEVVAERDGVTLLHRTAAGTGVRSKR
ncbi:DUF2079 domain-containing protein [Streptomyces sp. FIT100]|uniref:DUF2079 domain-containing protein n=1 Tax=Streptomyces sp. FIT100 TaxID=2837956 RepID=UPI0021C95C8B|nr:DUF2079 domain-containing protein [Streptomyces sp. FIT100]UUN28931.1 DUF2079 domain-containing protein [Streptomyces sp. FIT100]